MRVTANTEVLVISKKNFEKVFCINFQHVTNDFCEDAKMQQNLIKNVHHEAKDFFKNEYKENKVRIKAQNIDDLMNNIDLYSYLFDTELSKDCSDEHEDDSQSEEPALLPDKFIIKPGFNPILDGDSDYIDIVDFRKRI